MDEAVNVDTRMAFICNLLSGGKRLAKCPMTSAIQYFTA